MYIYIYAMLPHMGWMDASMYGSANGWMCEWTYGLRLDAWVADCMYV